MLLHSRERLQLDAYKPPWNALPQIHEGSQGALADPSKNLIREKREQFLTQRSSRIIHGRQRRANRRADR